MMKQFPTYWPLMLGLLILIPTLSWAQSARERSVELSVTIEQNPNRLLFTWPADASADQYQIYKKTLAAEDWGEPILLLDGTATSFTEENVQTGVAFEYAVFKKRYELLRDTVCVPPVAALNFTIKDMYGIGLCCNFGFGFYQVEACDSVWAYGDNFGSIDSTDFTICNSGMDCEPLVISLAPDMFPNSTSWTLTNQADGTILASSGEVGDFISDRSEYGFIYAGIEVPAVEEQGAVLLLVEEQINLALAAEIERLEWDLIREGWQVFQQTAQQEESVTAVKSRIQQLYAEQSNLTTLFIIGHVPVPYSGDIYPDTHSENHQGAWSADPYYGELNGHWTDEVANISTAQFERNHNFPGDGRFDQDSIPSPMELQVGRVDFFDMPAFSADEVELTRRYLNKDHAFRTGQITAKRRALVDDNFDNAFAAPAASAWRNFAPMFGADQIIEADYFSTLRDSSYLWSYGCGSGSHISASGIGTTDDFANDSLQTVFTMLFGSQFGDWDNGNNFLKAPLASGQTLTNCWAGNPPWTFHHMAMGYTVGYSAWRTQNSRNEVYLPGPQLVHTALMGDPTLKMHIVRPPENLTVVADGAVVNLNWSAPGGEPVAGYYLYRSTALDQPFERIHTDLITNTDYTDLPPEDGHYLYWLRAVQLEQSASGSYYNLSMGLIDSTDFVLGLSPQTPIPTQIELLPNPNQGQLQIAHQNLQGLFQIRLLDANGKMLWQEEAWAQSLAHTVFDLPVLADGLYMVQIVGREFQWSGPLLMEH